MLKTYRKKTNKMEDKVEFYTKIIVDLMIKYKSLFPVVETLYKGSEPLDQLKIVDKMMSGI